MTDGVVFSSARLRSIAGRKPVACLSAVSDGQGSAGQFGNCGATRAGDQQATYVTAKKRLFPIFVARI
jgi:hypothetical protein